MSDPSPTQPSTADPVGTTARLIGRKWHPAVLDRLHERPRGFNELQRPLPGISSKTLSTCLTDLEAKGLLDREVVSERPVRVEYSLTPRGESLGPVLDAMAAWGRERLEPADASEEGVARVPGW